jgi:hypothetical protein
MSKLGFKPGGDFSFFAKGNSHFAKIWLPGSVMTIKRKSKPHRWLAWAFEGQLNGAGKRKQLSLMTFVFYSNRGEICALTGGCLHR